MKRINHLYHSAFSVSSLFEAYTCASKGKSKKKKFLDFDCNLGVQLHTLQDELLSGTYQPQSYYSFFVYEPKKREIFAPAFRDHIVQYAIYNTILPIFESSFIDQSFACRIGKGTHKAADYAQAALRKSKPGSYTLKLDIKKFFYRIDRDILKVLLEKKIKDDRLISLLMQFATYESPLGIPIGNLLSQLYALIYLNPLDHFIKRELKVKQYCRYVDDFICFNVVTKTECKKLRNKIVVFLQEQLNLELSYSIIAPTKNGVNFVGYRTWRSRRFIRKHSLYKFNKAVKQNNKEIVMSLLGHALHTSSYFPMKQYYATL